MKTLVAKTCSSLRRGRRQSGFTMVEIAICLAIVAFAMVAIMGVLPAGMEVQKENREDTLINFEGTYYLEAIRSGSTRLWDLTNYVESIRTVRLDRNTRLTNDYTNLYPYQIVGLLSTPRVVYDQDLKRTITNLIIEAKIRARSGSAADKIPLSAERNQPTAVLADAIRDLSFSYLLRSEIVQYSLGPGELNATNGLNAAELAVVTNRLEMARQMTNNTFDAKLTLRWPVRQNHTAGNNSQVFRSMVSGALTVTNDAVNGRRVDLYFFQPLKYQRLP
ncbi:MAG TPA: type II secretion system protein [Candidatus Paceibacterota bacterium]|nr:type II secretion system protein [Verrucomicrobiota bacterium]HRY48184.1 type II secretion system protein [Candidatus Paceibacterota bacterium]